MHNKIDESLIPEWSTFDDFVAKELEYYESTSGYRNMILEKSNFDEEKAIVEFYKLFDLFRES